MKLFNNRTLIVLVVLISGFGYLASCTRDDNMIVPVELNKPFLASRGDNVHKAGTVTGDTSQWKFDKTHSSVLWETPYVGASGLLTGRFNQFGIHDVTDAKAIRYYVASSVQPLPDTSWAFYENDPSKTYFSGYVQINTSNTGEPGRDVGCNVSGMGTTALEPGVQMLNFPNLAKIKTTKVEFDPASNGYIVTLDLTYQGKLAAPLTKSVIGKLNYVKRQRVQFGTAAAYNVFGLQLKFSFNVRDFGITSTSIADKMDIECNMNFHNK